MSAFARKGEKILMAAVHALNPGKSAVEVAAIQVAVDDLPHVGPKETILLCKGLVVGLVKGLKMILNTLITGRTTRVAMTINTSVGGHGGICRQGSRPDDLACS